MQKIIVYTTNLGGYDELHNAPRDKNAEYLYYTDNEAPRRWKKIEMPTGDRRASRFYKINSHLLPPHDISIYIDACYIIKKPLTELALFLGDRDIAIAEHARDKCIYQHGTRIKQLKLDDPKKVDKQIRNYMMKGMPHSFGLPENSLIIRRNNDKIKELNQMWWKEYQNGSQRDQLSLPYCLWKLNIKIAWLPFSARNNDWLGNWANHIGSRIYQRNK